MAPAKGPAVKLKITVENVANSSPNLFNLNIATNIDSRMLTKINRTVVVCFLKLKDRIIKTAIAMIK